MKKICNNYYQHKGHDIWRSSQGIQVDNDINMALYKTLEDARQAVDKYHDGTNTREPRIVGYWSYEIYEAEQNRK